MMIDQEILSDYCERVTLELEGLKANEMIIVLVMVQNCIATEICKRSE